MAILLSLCRSWHVSACAMTWFISLVSRRLWGTGPCQLRWPCSLWLLLPFHLTATSQLGGPKLKLRQRLKSWQAAMISKRIKNCRYRGMLPRSCSVLKCWFFSTKTTPGINTLNDLFSYVSVFIASFFFEMVFFWGGWCWFNSGMVLLASLEFPIAAEFLIIHDFFHSQQWVETLCRSVVKAKSWGDLSWWGSCSCVWNPSCILANPVHNQNRFLGQFETQERSYPIPGLAITVLLLTDVWRKVGFGKH